MLEGDVTLPKWSCGHGLMIVSKEGTGKAPLCSSFPFFQGRPQYLSYTCFLPSISDQLQFYGTSN